MLVDLGYGQRPVPVDSDNPDDDNDKGRDHSDQGFIHPQPIQDIVQYSSKNTGCCIDLFLEDKGYLVRQDVPHDPACGGRHHAHHNGHQETVIIGQCLPCAYYEESAETQGVEVQQWPVQKIQAVMIIEDQKGNHNGEVEIVLVVKAERRHRSQQDIPYSTPTYSCDQSQDDHSEKVHSPLDTGEGAGGRESCCTQ